MATNSAVNSGGTNITTLGTITTGTWNGSVVTGTYGGTGVNNGANTITLAGNLATSGANALTFTTTGSTNVTLPTTGTLATTAQVVAWSEVTGTSATMSGNNGYIANNASLVTLTLPTTIAQGQSIYVQGKGAGGWKIAQNSGQTVNFGNAATTTGATGSLASTNQYDSILLLCITANTTFTALTGPQGNLTVV